jgi:hypothetical protein
MEKNSKQQKKPNNHYLARCVYYLPETAGEERIVGWESNCVSVTL